MHNIDQPSVTHKNNNVTDRSDYVGNDLGNYLGIPEDDSNVQRISVIEQENTGYHVFGEINKTVNIKNTIKDISGNEMKVNECTIGDYRSTGLLPAVSVSDYDVDGVDGDKMDDIPKNSESEKNDRIRKRPENDGKIRQRRFGVTSLENDVSGTEKLGGRRLRGSYSFSYRRKDRGPYRKIRHRSEDVEDNEDDYGGLLITHNDRVELCDNDVRDEETENQCTSEVDLNQNTVIADINDRDVIHFNNNVVADIQKVTENNVFPLVDNKNAKSPSEEALLQVKETATRLHLHTRRPSYLAWREQYLDNRPYLTRLHERAVCESVKEEPDTAKDATSSIDESLSWLRDELIGLRMSDKQLALQLLTLRRDIQRMKLEKTCEDHVDMLEDLQDELEGLHQICDIDICAEEVSLGPNPLKQIGVTKLNLFARRFSTC